MCRIKCRIVKRNEVPRNDTANKLTGYTEMCKVLRKKMESQRGMIKAILQMMVFWSIREGIFFRANQEILAGLGISLRWEQFEDISLTRGQSVLRLASNPETDAFYKLRRERDALYADLLTREPLLIDGVREVLDALKGKYVMGIVQTDEWRPLRRVRGMANQWTCVCYASVRDHVSILALRAAHHGWNRIARIQPVRLLVSLSNSRGPSGDSNHYAYLPQAQLRIAAGLRPASRWLFATTPKVVQQAIETQRVLGDPCTPLYARWIVSILATSALSYPWPHTGQLRNANTPSWVLERHILPLRSISMETTGPASRTLH